VNQSALQNKQQQKKPTNNTNTQPILTPKASLNWRLGKHLDMLQHLTL